MSVTNTSAGVVDVEWSLHITDAGEPPSIVTVALWLVSSLCVAVLFLVVRPAASRQVQRDAATESIAPKGLRQLAHYAASSYVLLVWRLLFAVWTWALYDVFHRTCCYLRLSAFMLARRQLLPLGVAFLRDGLWTEWVNWARFYFMCSTAAGPLSDTESDRCAEWKLPLAGVLPYTQYPEYAALNVSRLPTASEVDDYHRVSLEALVLTLMTVVQLHSFCGFVRHLYAKPQGSSEETPRDTAAAADSEGESGEPTRNAENTTETASLGDNGKAATASAAALFTSLDATAAPGDDAWVDSPEALAEEAARKSEGEQTPHDGSDTGDGGGARGSASYTTQLFQQCWPSLVSAGYAAMFAYVGGLPLLMTFVYPCATVMVCVLAMFAPA